MGYEKEQAPKPEEPNVCIVEATDQNGSVVGRDAFPTQGPSATRMRPRCGPRATRSSNPRCCPAAEFPAASPAVLKGPRSLSTVQPAASVDVGIRRIGGTPRRTPWLRTSRIRSARPSSIQAMWPSLTLPETDENVCPVCHGARVIDNTPCPNCGGTGVVIEGVGGG